MYAGDNEGKFPTGLRNNNMSHYPFISDDVFLYLRDKGSLSTNSFSCPNKQDWFRRGSVGYRLGYYYLWGHKTPKQPENYSPPPLRLHRTDTLGLPQAGHRPAGLAHDW